MVLRRIKPSKHTDWGNVKGRIEKGDKYRYKRYLKIEKEIF